MMNLFDEIAELGHLETVGEAIIDFVTVRSPNSAFEHTSSGEWALRPDNWIALKLTHQRKKAIHISLGVYTSTIDLEGERQSIQIKNGRFPNWSKISIYDRENLAGALDILKLAYRKSGNEHRQWHGYTPRPHNFLSISVRYI